MHKYFSQFHHAHFTGIKGVGMTSTAQCLADLGIAISGSDVADDFVTAHILKTVCSQVAVGFSPDHLMQEVDLVVYSGAHQGSKNPEVEEAIRRGITTMSQAEVLGKLMDGKRGVSVCGVGGKTTTSAMISWILWKHQNNPSFSVGVGGIVGMERTGAYTEGNIFVAEADEYSIDPLVDRRPRFTYQHPEIIVCTNIFHDHPDIYPTYSDTLSAYNSFFSQLSRSQSLIYFEDEKYSDDIKKMDFSCNLITIGKSDSSTFSYDLSSYRIQPLLNQFSFSHEQRKYTVRVSVPGLFNIKNVLSAIATCSILGIPIEESIEYMQSFRGTVRRFEYKMRLLDSIDCYDDYAHHPSEILHTLKALREWYPNARRVVVFQPHTYSRTKTLFHEFSHAFDDADVVIIPPIFASAREGFDPSITSDQLVSALTSQGKLAFSPSSLDETVELLKELLTPNDVLMTIGAGDVYHLHDMIQSAYAG